MARAMPLRAEARNEKERAAQYEKARSIILRAVDEDDYTPGKVSSLLDALVASFIYHPSGYDVAGADAISDIRDLWRTWGATPYADFVMKMADADDRQNESGIYKRIK